MEKHWTDAKIAKWATDSIEADLLGWKMTAALSWPTEPKPEPLPFRFGEYDRQIGEVQTGTYWVASWSIKSFSLSRPQMVHIRENLSKSWKPFEFSDDGENWTTSVTRGLLFATKEEAELFLLWEACEDMAKMLARLRGWIK